jgi:Uncharacterized protein conserved in bacteria (DUF2330)
MPLARWWISALLLLCLASRDAAAICREVTEKGSSPPAIMPDQEILVLKRSGVPVGCESGPDGAPDGAPTDAAPGDAAPDDAGTDAAADASPDGGLDAGLDAGLDGGLDAGDGCEPRLGDTVSWVVQPRFALGPDGSRFALLMVTPGVPVVETAPESTFEDLARTTAPLEVVEERYIEDARLGYQCQDPKFGGSQTGCGSFAVTGSDGWTPPDPSGETATDAGTPDGYIRVQTVGSYQVAVLNARDGDELAEWLDRADYEHDDDDIAALRPYLEAGWTVSAVRVTADKSVTDGGLEPLSFTFEGTDMRLPLGIARQPAGGYALLRIYIAAEGRYEVPGADLFYADRVPDQASTFLTASLLEIDLARTADDDPVAERAAADTTFRKEYKIEREIRIPSSECPSDDDGACDCGVGGNPAGQLGTLLLAAACAAVVLRRRRRARPPALDHASRADHAPGEQTGRPAT